MKLPGISSKLPFKKKQVPSNYFLTLTIGKEKVDAVIFEETLRRVKVMGHSTQYLDEDIEKIQDEPLLNSLDKAISEAEKNLPSNIETQNTIMGLDGSWVESGKIKKEELLRLKKISEDLDLKPMGFIVTSEAVSHLIQKEEGAPISAIVTEVGKKYLTATLFRGGRVVEAKTALIAESAPNTLNELLKHFSTPEVLPSRIIVFGETNEDLNQKFVGFSWSKSLPFLHLPQVSPMEKTLDSKAVLYGAASQMNFIVEDTQALGSQGQNIAELSELDNSQKIPTDEIIKNPASEDFFGFVEGEDVSKDTPQIPTDNPAINPNEFKEEVPEIPEELKISNDDSQELPTNASNMLIGFKLTLARIIKNIKIPSKTKLPAGNRKMIMIIVPGALIILLLFLFIFLFASRSAVITLDVAPKSAEKTTDVTFSQSSSTDPSSGTIKSETVPVTEDGKLSTNTTGKKQTGDKAKGTVTIFNLNQNPKTYSAGTTIASANNLNFTLDNSVTVATGSSDPTNPSAGTANVNVTASNFGTDYNLPSGTKFTIGSDPLVAAKNDNAFSGGTTKNITVVSDDDLTKLSSDIVKNLQDQAKQDVQSKISSDQVLLPDFASTSFNLKNYNHKSGDEATSVSLTATVEYDGVTYSKDDLNSFVEQLFNEELGGNLTVNNSDTSVEVKDIKQEKNKDVSATLNISTKIVPNINQQQLIDSVQGKSVSQASDTLSKIPQVDNATIKLSPGIFFFPKVLPSASKIKIVINTNG